MGPCKVSEFGARCACFAFPLLETWTVRDRLLRLLFGGSVPSQQTGIVFCNSFNMSVSSGTLFHQGSSLLSKFARDDTEKANPLLGLRFRSVICC